MSFSLNLLVHNAEPALVEAMCQRSGLARVSRSGTLVVRRTPDHDLSKAIYPSEWKSLEGRHRPIPDFSGGVVHKAYTLPEELADVPYIAVLDEAEVHMRRSYCQIVTNYEGGKLRPYRRESSSRGRWGGEYNHPTASVFSAPQMGLLRFDCGVGFTIQRGTIEVIDGLLTVKIEELLRDGGKCELTKKLTSLPEDLTAWLPALTTVLERFDCDLNSCQGHYHLD